MSEEESRISVISRRLNTNEILEENLFFIVVFLSFQLSSLILHSTYNSNSSTCDNKESKSLCSKINVHSLRTYYSCHITEDCRNHILPIQQSVRLRRFRLGVKSVVIFSKKRLYLLEK
jgi:hypothetical protein